MMAHICESQLLRKQRSGVSWFKTSLGKNLVRPYFNHQARCGNLSYSGGIGKRSESGPEQKVEPLSKK
jgi:hypothetical protein